MITLDRISDFVGKVARPSAIITTSWAAAAATVIIALKVQDGNDGFIFIGGVFAGVAVIYGAKAAEEFGKSRNAANVEMARATGNTPGPQEVVVTNSPGDPVHVEETRPAPPSGERP